MPFNLSGKIVLHVLPSMMSLQLVDRSTKTPRGIVEDVFVQIGNFTNFVVLDMGIDDYVLLGKCFIDILKALIDVSNRKLKLVLDKDEISVNFCFFFKISYEFR